MVTRRLPRGVTAEVPLRRSDRGGSGSFLVRADDARRYWCKVVDNPQHPKVPANEEIVGRVGRLVGVAVCDPRLIWIPADLVGWEFQPGRQLREGWAHGSLAVEQPVVEVHDLRHRGEDNNASRHAGFLALHDWVCGQDDQWLVANGAQNMYWSHDHGHFLPDGPGWSIASLDAAKDRDCPLSTDTVGLDPVELERLAGLIESTTDDELSDVLADLPTDWPVSDEELDAVVAFLTHRGPAVASRLRSLASGGAP